MYYIFLGAAMLFCLWAWGAANRKLFGDLVSPFNVLLFAWVGPLFVRGFGLSDYERPWSLDVGLVLIWVTFCLAGTSLLAKPLLRGSKAAAQRIVFQETIRIFQNRVVLILMLAVFVISFAAYIYNEFINSPVGVPMLAYLRDPTINLVSINRWGKTHDTGTVWAYFTAPLQGLVPMLYLGFRANPRRKWRWLFFLVAALYPVMSALKLSRIDLIYGVVSMGIIEHYYRMYVYVRPAAKPYVTFMRFARNALLILLGVGVLHSFVSIRAGEDPSAGSTIGEKIGLHIDAGPLTGSMEEVYGYFALPIENFANFYQGHSGGGSLGVGPLRPLFSLAGQGRLADSEMKRLYLDRFLLLPANTYTFLTLTYAELGLPGLVVVPVVYGVLISLLYARFRRRPNFVNLFLYLNFLPCWMWLFATNGFSVLGFYLNGAFVLGFYEICKMLSGSGWQVQQAFSRQAGRQSDRRTSREDEKRFGRVVLHRR